MNSLENFLAALLATHATAAATSSSSSASEMEFIPGIQSDGSDRFRPVKELGSGQFGTTLLMEDRHSSGELVAVKFLERGRKIDKNVEREILNHMQLSGHPNIVQFREVFLTPTHLGIVMDFASGGELFQRIASAGTFPEDEARYFFQQLVSGVGWCHRQGVCHRDLKLENSLLDGGPAYRLKICDFGYSKNTARDSVPKTMCGTPAYIAPEVLLHKRYDGKVADVWSCGVTLYVMLVGAYPFEDPVRPNDYGETIKRIMAARYTIPADVRLSGECQNLLRRIFQADPCRRITLAQIKQHPWFLKNLPEELQDDTAAFSHIKPQFRQSAEEIRSLVEAARAEASGMMLG